jgi:tetratricopeptide (TPR) repeat protein
MSLKLADDRATDECEQQLYTSETLCDILQVPADRLQSWITAGLIKPASSRLGVAYFDFSQVTAARSLCDLVHSGINLKKLRGVLERLRGQNPNAGLSLDRLIAVRLDGSAIFRTDAGLVQDDGQLHLEFDDEQGLEALPLAVQPQSAAEWFQEGVEAEGDGKLEDAANCYRNALRVGGPSAQICFDLAGVLSALGQKYQALERYLQVVEIDPQHSDGWNNLGVTLCELNRHEEAVAAFEESVRLNRGNVRAIYNLADCLSELGRDDESRKQWREYLKYDQSTEFAVHARRMVR